MKNLLYRLLFTRDDDLDVLQIVFLIIVMFFMYSFAKAGAKEWEVTNMAWTTFVTVFGTLAIAGTPKWIAILIANKDKSNSHSSIPLPPEAEGTDDQPIEEEDKG